MDADNSKFFHKNFGYGSILSLIIFLFGIETLYLYLRENISLGNIFLLLSLILYIINNILLNIFDLKNDFNDFLENMAIFLTFGLTTIVYGILNFENDWLFISIVFIYSICLVLSLSRNKISSLSNSIGWPVALNGLFFPLLYYINQIYLKDFGDSIFITYYVIISILLISKYDFLGSPENKEPVEESIVNMDE